MSGPAKILAVDDSVETLDLMERHLATAGLRTLRAEDGRVALRKLEEDSQICAIVLDKVMPDLDGMEFLRRVKADARFTEVPVIMVTAAPAEEEAAQGIRAGLRYYLSKPFDAAMLLGVVNAALEDSKNRKFLAERVRGADRGLKLMQEARFNFRTLDDAADLACNIATCFPDPGAAVLGLLELMLNAVEHGNLGIDYREKSELIRNGRWRDEIERRLGLPENRQRFATLTFKASEDAIVVDITDKGDGFDWRPYMHFSPERATDLNGRGIATCRALSFPDLQYLGSGNVARCAVRLKRDAGR
jgi:DNA-binding response OmpR family regulator